VRVVGIYAGGSYLCDAQLLQNTLSFLVEHECPFQLRVQILKWTRFNVSHREQINAKEEMIAR
jgi:hypothetical protein